MNLNKLFGWSVKLASLVVTAPATWAAAGKLADLTPGYPRLLMQIAGLLVVELVFLHNWYLLEQDKRADMAYKVRYGLTAFGMYAGLWILAWAHGEGVVGLIFRLALGAALIGAIYDAGVYDLLRTARRADNDVSKIGRVRRLSRRLSIDDARVQLRLDSEHRQAVMQVEHRARMQGVQVYGERLLDSVQVDTLTLDTGQSSGAQVDSLLSTEHWTGEHLDTGQLDTLTLDTGQSDKSVKLDTLLDTLLSNPNLSKSKLAGRVGVSRTTLYTYLDELQADGRIVEADTGSGYAVPAREGVNGHRA